MANPSQFDGAGGTNRDGLLVHLADVLGPHNVGNQRKDGFGFGMVGGGLAEEILQNWNLRESWNACEGTSLLVFQHAAKQVDLTFLQADLMLDFALSDDRLLN